MYMVMYYACWNVCLFICTGPGGKRAGYCWFNSWTTQVLLLWTVRQAVYQVFWVWQPSQLVWSPSQTGLCVAAACTCTSSSFTLDFHPSPAFLHPNLHTPAPQSETLVLRVLYILWPECMNNLCFDQWCWYSFINNTLVLQCTFSYIVCNRNVY